VDLGSVGVAGQSYIAAPGFYIVQGSGEDIWGSSDAGHYMYFETSGDATFTVLVEGFESADSWAKAGIMYRDNLSASSSHYSLFTTNSNGLANQYRTCAACESQHWGEYRQFSAIWLRVTKVGNVLRSYYRSTGAEYYTPFGAVVSITRISSNGYYIGVAVTSRSNSGVATLEVSNIQLTRTCSSDSITQLQCEQASNCESGLVTGGCYSMGEAPSWERMEHFSNILDVGSTVTRFGCQETWIEPSNNALDQTTNKFICDREGLLGEPTGIIIKPSHYRLSIAEGLRVYAHNDCPECDPVSFIIEGRPDSASEWFQISQGDLPWKSATTFPRNSIMGLDIDDSLAYTEVFFYDQESETPDVLNEYMEYKITWTATRNPAQLLLQFAEIEVFGLLDDEPALPTLEYTGDYVGSVAEGTTDVSLAGGSGSGQMAVDGDTNKFSMYRDSATATPGVRIAPLHGRMSVATGLRLYSSNNNHGADPVKYRIEGRGMPGAILRTRQSDECLDLSDYTLALSSDCGSRNYNLRFHFNELGEFRAKSIPGYCLDPRYGMNSNVQRNYFIPCFSDSHGPDHEYASYHKFTYDSSERFESVYYNNRCIDYDANSGWVGMKNCNSGVNQKFYVSEGTLDGTDVDWTTIEEDDLPWISQYDRNPVGIGISSTYENGDTDKNYREVKFFDNTTPYYEYKISFPELKNPESLELQFAEVELPGLLLPEGW
jgi:hypothetical protein